MGNNTSKQPKDSGPDPKSPANGYIAPITTGPVGPFAYRPHKKDPDKATGWRRVEPAEPLVPAEAAKALAAAQQQQQQQQSPASPGTSKKGKGASGDTDAATATIAVGGKSVGKRVVTEEGLKVLTFNVWFSFKLMITRAEALVALVEAENPHVVCFQELTKPQMEVLMASEYFRAFTTSGAYGDGGYGVAIFSRIPVVQYGNVALQTALGRSLVYADAVFGGVRVLVGTCHLESYKNDVLLRTEQLTAIFAKFRELEVTGPPVGLVLYMGDCNFDPFCKENELIAANAFEDTWVTLHGDDPGFTEDTYVNVMRYEAKNEHKTVRIDRIMHRGVRGSGPLEMRIIGNEPIDEDGTVFISDHFGLTAVFSFNPVAVSAARAGAGSAAGAASPASTTTASAGGTATAPVSGSVKPVSPGSAKRAAGSPKAVAGSPKAAAGSPKVVASKSSGGSGGGGGGGSGGSGDGTDGGNSEAREGSGGGSNENCDGNAGDASGGSDGGGSDGDSVDEAELVRLDDGAGPALGVNRIVSSLGTVFDILEGRWALDPDNVAVVPFTPTASEAELPERPRFLLCHDMKGGYLEDDTNSQGGPFPDAYTTWHWHWVDIFCYFSHDNVSIPPPQWTNAAHRAGVRVIGTFITEWDAGAEMCSALLASEESIETAVGVLVDAAVYCGFDGWFVNIENPIAKNRVDRLKLFVKRLTEAMHAAVPHSQVIYYDSVTSKGELKWQNYLCDLNKPYFDVCDGLFTNYTWKTGELCEASHDAAGRRCFDVYTGIDVFGRGTYGGGGWDCNLALQAIQAAAVSAALFAPGWVHETLPVEDFVANETKLWSNMSPCWTEKPVVRSLPFWTTFEIGRGSTISRRGQILSTKGWCNRSLQSAVPTSFDDVLTLVDTRAVGHGVAVSSGGGHRGDEVEESESYAGDNEISSCPYVARIESAAPYEGTASLAVNFGPVDLADFTCARAFEASVSLESLGSASTEKRGGESIRDDDSGGGDGINGDDEGGWLVCRFVYRARGRSGGSTSGGGGGGDGDGDTPTGSDLGVGLELDNGVLAVGCAAAASNMRGKQAAGGGDGDDGGDEGETDGGVLQCPAGPCVPVKTVYTRSRDESVFVDWPTVNELTVVVCDVTVGAVASTANGTGPDTGGDAGGEWTTVAFSYKLGSGRGTSGSASGGNSGDEEGASGDGESDGGLHETGPATELCALHFLNYDPLSAGLDVEVGEIVVDYVAEDPCLTSELSETTTTETATTDLSASGSGESTYTPRSVLDSTWAREITRASSGGDDGDALTGELSWQQGTEVGLMLSGSATAVATYYDVFIVGGSGGSSGDGAGEGTDTSDGAREFVARTVNKWAVFEWDRALAPSSSESLSQSGGTAASPARQRLPRVVVEAVGVGGVSLGWTAIPLLTASE